VRRLQPPTLAQWTCAHQWRTTTSRPGKGDILRVRYLTCRRCGLKVKTEEQLAVSWGEQELVALVAQAFPEDAVVDMATLKAHGLLGGGLSQLNACLVPHDWQLELVRDLGRVVGAVRRRIAPESVGGTNGKLEKGRNRRHSNDGY
jgi:hypothetical protein